MRRRDATILGCLAMCAIAATTDGQEYGAPDRGAPGDEMIQRYLARETEKLHGRFLEGVQTLEDWQKLRARYRREYFRMPGLSPMPAKTPLKAAITAPRRSPGASACRRWSTSAGTPAAGETATRWPTSRTASGSPATGTPAGRSTRSGSREGGRPAVVRWPAPPVESSYERDVPEDRRSCRGGPGAGVRPRVRRTRRGRHKSMKARKHRKLVHEGSYAAEVEVERIDSDEGWGPYLSIEEVRKLDEVRRALQHEDIEGALKVARVYRLTPIESAESRATRRPWL